MVSSDETDETDEKADEEAIEQASEDEAGTASTRWRWKWLSTGTAGVTILAWLGFVGAHLGGHASISSLGTVTVAVLHTSYGMAMVYSLGTETLRAWKEANVAGGTE